MIFSHTTATKQIITHKIVTHTQLMAAGTILPMFARHVYSIQHNLLLYQMEKKAALLMLMMMMTMREKKSDKMFFFFFFVFLPYFFPGCVCDQGWELSIFDEDATASWKISQDAMGFRHPSKDAMGCGGMLWDAMKIGIP